MKHLAILTAVSALVFAGCGGSTRAGNPGVEFGQPTPAQNIERDAGAVFDRVGLDLAHAGAVVERLLAAGEPLPTDQAALVEHGFVAASPDTVIRVSKVQDRDGYCLVGTSKHEPKIELYYSNVEPGAHQVSLSPCYCFDLDLGHSPPRCAKAQLTPP